MVLEVAGARPPTPLCVPCCFCNGPMPHRWTGDQALPSHPLQSHTASLALPVLLQISAYCSDGSLLMPFHPPGVPPTFTGPFSGPPPTSTWTDHSQDGAHAPSALRCAYTRAAGKPGVINLFAHQATGTLRAVWRAALLASRLTVKVLHPYRFCCCAEGDAGELHQRSRKHFPWTR